MKNVIHRGFAEGPIGRASAFLGIAFAALSCGACGAFPWEAKNPNPVVEEQSPYGGSPWALPCAIEAELYDRGGPGISYEDSDGENLGGALRPRDSVDIEATGTVGPGFNLAWIEPGEWLEYSVTAPADGIYRIGFRYSSLFIRQHLSVSIDGEDATGRIVLPLTGGWDEWGEFRRPGVAIPAGEHVLRISFDSGFLKLDRMDIEADPSGLAVPPAVLEPYDWDGDGDREPFPLSATVPARLEAEWYCEGGWGLAYDDSSLGNAGSFRHDEDVDTEACADSGGGYQITDMAAGEYLVYSVVAPAAGSWRLGIRYATTAWYGGRYFTLAMRKATETEWRALVPDASDGRYSLGADEPFYLVNTDSHGWYMTRTIDSISFDAGEEYLIRVTSGNGAMVLNWLEFNPDADGPPLLAVQGPWTDRIAWTDPAAQYAVEAEHFDSGGEGVAYHDDSGGQYSGDTSYSCYRQVQGDAAALEGDIVDVDIARRDIDGDGDLDDGYYCIGYIGAGEWLEYTVDVPETACYDLSFVHQAAYSEYWGESPNILVTDFSGGTASTPGGPVYLPSTLDAAGDLQWSGPASTAKRLRLPLTEGIHVLRLGLATNGWITALDSFSLRRNDAVLDAHGQAPFSGGAIAAAPRTIAAAGATRIQAEDFDYGPWAPPDPPESRHDYVNYASFDWTPGNWDGGYRQEDPEIEVCQDSGGGWNLCRPANEEWMKYSVDVVEAGTYSLRLRYAAMSDSASYYPMRVGITVPGNDELVVRRGRTTESQDGYQDSWSTAEEGIYLPAGSYQIRLRFYEWQMALNWLEFERRP